MGLKGDSLGKRRPIGLKLDFHRFTSLDFQFSLRMRLITDTMKVLENVQNMHTVWA